MCGRLLRTAARAMETPNQPLQPSHSAVTRLAWASRAPAGGRLNGGVRQPEEVNE